MGFKSHIPPKVCVAVDVLESTYKEAKEGQLFQTDRNVWVKPSQDELFEGMLVDIFTGSVLHYSHLSFMSSKFEPISHNEVIW